ncbi:MAG: hypothetical protein Q7S65_03055 [Nanoarchaeota archaeon]|nr:hypothetical protein [Nanoarchaeota archaeon]
MAIDELVSAAAAVYLDSVQDFGDVLRDGRTLHRPRQGKRAFASDGEDPKVLEGFFLVVNGPRTQDVLTSQGFLHSPSDMTPVTSLDGFMGYLARHSEDGANIWDKSLGVAIHTHQLNAPQRLQYELLLPGDYVSHDSSVPVHDARTSAYNIGTRTASAIEVSRQNPGMQVVILKASVFNGLPGQLVHLRGGYVVDRLYLAHKPDEATLPFGLVAVHRHYDTQDYTQFREQQVVLAGKRVAPRTLVTL